LHAFIATWWAVVLTAAVAVPAFPQNPTADLRSRFRQETNPVQKAKLMPALGDAEFAEIRKDVEAENFSEALTLLRTYRDETQLCVKGLDSTKADAEKHPAGFKQLEISLQESLRRVDMLLPAMTRDEQAPFLDVRKDLDDMNRHLIEQLFPGRTPEPPKSEKPKG